MFNSQSKRETQELKRIVLEQERIIVRKEESLRLYAENIDRKTNEISRLNNEFNELSDKFNRLIELKEDVVRQAFSLQSENNQLIKEKNILEGVLNQLNKNKEEETK